MQWTEAKPNQENYEVKVYRTGDDGTDTEIYSDTITWGNNAEIWSDDGLFYRDMENGTYYFTVTAVGDGETYESGDTVLSNPWVYVKSETPLDAVCTDLAWDGSTQSWKFTGDISVIAYFSVEIYNAATEDGEFTCIGGSRWGAGDYRSLEDETRSYSASIPGSLTWEGWYYFKVRALSKDTTAYTDGAWVTSPALYIDGDMAKVRQQINDIYRSISYSSTDEEKAAAISAVQTIGAEQLKSALAADMEMISEYLGGTELIAAGGRPDVEITSAVSDQISGLLVYTSGANLNPKADDTDSITKVYDIPQTERVYRNSASVQFSFTLDNVKDPHNLAVPFLTCVYVPNTIDPDSLVILRYASSEAEPEMIRPRITKGNDRPTCASFIVSGSGDFVMVQEGYELVSEGDSDDALTQEAFAEEYDAASSYTLTKSVTLTGDLTLDGGISIGPGGKLVVPDSVTLTVSGNLSIDGGLVEVKSGGKLTTPFTLYVNSGTLTVASDGVLDTTNVLANFDNGTIEGVNPAHVHALAQVKTPDRITELLEQQDRYNRIDIQVCADMDLPSMVIPSYSTLCIEDGVTAVIPKNATVSGEDGVSVSGNLLQVEGSLMTKCPVSLAGYGRLVIAGGKVTSEISIYTQSSEQSAVLERITGCSSDELRITQVSVQDGKTKWSVQCIVGLTVLAAPADLQWNWEISEQVRPNGINWTPVEPSQGVYEISVYCVEEDGSTTQIDAIQYSEDVTSGSLPPIMGVSAMQWDQPESGAYYFTVKAVGDGITYADSDTARSTTWNYTKPDRQISAACIDLSWNGKYAKWVPDDPLSEVGGYGIRFYYASSESSTPMMVYGSELGESCTEVKIADDVLQMYGDGWYYFCIQPLSKDITSACHGEWSEMSPGYQYMQDVETVKQQLDEISVSEESSDEEKANAISAVQSVGVENLKTAMQVDSAIVDRLAELEQTAASGTVQVEVTLAVNELIAENKVSIVGANLNRTENSMDDIKLIVDKPQIEHVLPTVYQNTVSVQFSMTLENVTDAHNLDVPVQVKLPIPNSINPKFLTILHYSVSGGEPEQIKPEILSENGQLYARFILTGFSDFAMVQEESDYVLGDINGDGKVDVMDLIRLRKHLAGIKVDIELCVADVTGEGKVNVMDLIRLRKCLAGEKVVLM